jgi:hypothetical protein
MNHDNPYDASSSSRSGTLPPTGHDPRQPDMSPEAIAARLKMVDELRRLCLSLREAPPH